MWHGFFVARFSRRDFTCVVMIDAVILAVIALVLFEEGIFLVTESIFVCWALFSRGCVLIEEPIVVLGLFRNAVRFSLKTVIVLWAAVVLRVHLRMVLETGSVYSVHAWSGSISTVIARS